MVEFVKAYPEHFKHIRITSEQSDEFRGLLTPAYASGLCSSIAFTAWHAGECLGAAGILKLDGWPDRGECWSILGEAAKRHMPTIIRFIRRVVTLAPERRLDMLVVSGNDKGEKLAKLCGFEYEATLEAYHPMGYDVHMYKRMRRK